MPVSSIEYQSLVARVEALEDKVNDIITGLTRLITIDQVTQLALIRQTDISTLQTLTDGLEARVAILESYHQT